MPIGSVVEGRKGNSRKLKPWTANKVINKGCHDNRYGMAWYGMVLYGMVWCGTLWYNCRWYKRQYERADKRKKGRQQATEMNGTSQGNKKEKGEQKIYI